LIDGIFWGGGGGRLTRPNFEEKRTTRHINLEKQKTKKNKKKIRRRAKSGVTKREEGGGKSPKRKLEKVHFRGESVGPLFGCQNKTVKAGSLSSYKLLFGPLDITND